MEIKSRDERVGAKMQQVDTDKMVVELIRRCESELDKFVPAKVGVRYEAYDVVTEVIGRYKAKGYRVNWHREADVPVFGAVFGALFGPLDSYIEIS